MKKYRLVEITWVDAWSGIGWEERDYHTCEGTLCTTVGYVLERNNKGYKTAHSIDHGNDNVSGVSFRPHGMIKKVRVLS